MENSGGLSFILKFPENFQKYIYEMVKSLSIKFLRWLEVSSRALNFVTFDGRTFHHYGRKNVLNWVKIPGK